MKTVLRFIPMSALLILSMNAISAPLQQPAFAASLIFNAAEFATVKNAVYVSDDDSSTNAIDIRYKNAVERLKQQETSLTEYAKVHHFSTEYCFLVDMSIPSGKNRFFVYNMEKDSVEYASLVAHGFGSDRPGKDQLEFSNVPNSFKTSLGRYKIGNSYNGNYGLAYKLYGLDSTNSKVYQRAIVLHSDI
ncbi:MAG: murein L,D-transpeptidase catalytic domain family protein, partial [Bacteroidia bacterium]|nr:murein L,D-transpeptidase catalytic domain family protein [Bacteroidia bacterium]